MAPQHELVAAALKLKPNGRKGAQTMEFSDQPFVCPSLARGIRCAYLETPDTSWADIGRLIQFRGRVIDRLIDIWKKFGWVIREREARPGKMDAAWLEQNDKGETCA